MFSRVSSMYAMEIRKLPKKGNIQAYRTAAMMNYLVILVGIWMTNFHLSTTIVLSSLRGYTSVFAVEITAALQWCIIPTSGRNIDREKHALSSHKKLR